MPLITIDGKEIHAEEGERILWAALREGIYIPHLCAMEEADLPFGGCRLCFVELETAGDRRLVAACSEPVREGHRVITKSDNVERLRRMAFELIMSAHQIDCRRCAGKGRCQLLRIASFLKVSLKPHRLRDLSRARAIDDSHALFAYAPDKCVNCGRCVIICEKLGKSFLNFAGRGFETVVTTFDGIPLAETGCADCVECVKKCPTGALFFKEQGGSIPHGEKIFVSERD